MSGSGSASFHRKVFELRTDTYLPRNASGICEHEKEYDDSEKRGSEFGANALIFGQLGDRPIVQCRLVQLFFEYAGILHH